MAVQETIAFIGGAEKISPALMKKMASRNFRLLFISEKEDGLQEFIKDLEADKAPEAEIEQVQCAKNSCWEADFIAFIDPESVEREVVDKIREVTTQKAVLFISTESDGKPVCTEKQTSDLEDLLPHSNIVAVSVNPEGEEASVSGKDEEALLSVSEIFVKCGYAVKMMQENRA